MNNILSYVVSHPTECRGYVVEILLPIRELPSSILYQQAGSPNIFLCPPQYPQPEKSPHTEYHNFLPRPLISSSDRTVIYASEKVPLNEIKNASPS